MTQTIQAASANLALSPSNWFINNGSISTLCGGAYFSVFFNGTTIAINLDISNMGNPPSQLYYRVDGYNAQSPWTRVLVASTINCPIPSDTAGWPYHMLEVFVKSTSEFVNRWNAPSNSEVIVNSITIDNGAVLIKPKQSDKTVVMYGDSITEAFRTVNYTAANDTDQSDSMMGWAYAQRHLLGAEVGTIGYGGSGITGTGQGGVPRLALSYNLFKAGATRPTNPNVDLVVLNEGTNDQGAASTFTDLYIEALDGIAELYPNATLAVLQTFGGYLTQETQAAVKGAKGNVVYVDTTGILIDAYGVTTDDYHPSGPNNLSIIAPQVANKLRPLLYKSGNKFRSMFNL